MAILGCRFKFKSTRAECERAESTVQKHQKKSPKTWSLARLRAPLNIPSTLLSLSRWGSLGRSLTPDRSAVRNTENLHGSPTVFCETITEHSQSHAATSKLSCVLQKDLKQNCRSPSHHTNLSTGPRGGQADARVQREPGVTRLVGPRGQRPGCGRQAGRHTVTSLPKASIFPFGNRAVESDDLNGLFCRLKFQQAPTAGEGPRLAGSWHAHPSPQVRLPPWTQTGPEAGFTRSAGRAPDPGPDRPPSVLSSATCSTAKSRAAHKTPGRDPDYPPDTRAAETPRPRGETGQSQRGPGLHPRASATPCDTVNTVSEDCT